MENNFKTVRKNNNDLHIVLILLLVIVSSFFLQVKNDSGYIPLGKGVKIPEICLFKIVTGYNCPSCGMTRSFVSISHLDFAGAFGYNAAGLFAYLLCILLIISYSMKLFSFNNSIQRAFNFAVKVDIVLVAVMIIINWLLYFINL